MTLHASWVHGNALMVESPGFLEKKGYLGWGADMLVQKGMDCWFHIPLPTPVIVGGARSSLLRVFLLFRTEHGMIGNVHVYDGSQLVQEYNDLMSKGEHRFELDALNTFELAAPHAVAYGMGISFLFTANVALDSAIPPPRLIVASAGGDYES